MATLASLMVDIGANVARLQTDMNRAKGVLDGFARSAKTIMGGIGAYMGSQQIFDMSNMAMQFEEQKDSLNSLAAQYGKTADSIIESIQRVSKGMVSQAAAAGIAGEALMKGLNPEQVTKLAQASETLSNVTGKKVADTFRDLSEALESGKTKAVKAAIGIVDLDAKYGNLTSTMSETEKAQALYNEVIERTTKLQNTLGDSLLSNADKMEKLATKWEDLKLTLGQGFIRAALAAAGAFNWIAAGALNAYGGVIKFHEGIAWLISKIPGLTKFGEAMKKNAEEAANNAFGAASELMAKSMENFKTAFSEKADIAVKIKPKVDLDTGNLKKAQDALKSSLSARLKDFEKYYSDLKGMQNEYKAAIEKSLKEIAEIDKKILESRRSTQELMYQAWDKGNPAANDMEAYNRKVIKLQEELSYAMTLSGEDRIKALQDYQRQWLDMIKQIDYTEIERKFDMSGGLGSSADWVDTEVTKTWLSIGDAAKTAGGQINYAGELIAQAQEDMKASAEAQLGVQIDMFNKLSEAINLADQWVVYLKNTIADLDKGLANPRTLIIDCAPALAQLQSVLVMVQQVQAAISGMGLVGVGGMPGETITTVSLPSGYGGMADARGNYAEGTYYNNPAMSGVTVNMGGVTFNNTPTSDPTEMAKQLVGALEKELNRRSNLRA